VRHRVTIDPWTEGARFLLHPGRRRPHGGDRHHRRGRRAPSGGLVHGFLTLSTLAGETLADGDLIQTTRGTRVTSRLVFHFRDGSLHDETAVFTQGRTFRLLTDHLVQKGRRFRTRWTRRSTRPAATRSFATPTTGRRRSRTTTSTPRPGSRTG
jgi:hypothetical protein